MELYLMNPMIVKGFILGGAVFIDTSIAIVRSYPDVYRYIMNGGAQEEAMMMVNQVQTVTLNFVTSQEGIDLMCAVAKWLLNIN